MKVTPDNGNQLVVINFLEKNFKPKGRGVLKKEDLDRAYEIYKDHITLDTHLSSLPPYQLKLDL